MLQERYGIHGTYLDYMQLINRIPRLRRDIINENSEKSASYKNNVQINYFVFLSSTQKARVQRHI